MKQHPLTIPLALLLCLTFACQRQGQEVAKEHKASVEADVAAVRALIGDWVRLYNARDFDRLMSVFYAEDSVLMSPAAPARVGKEAILLSYQKDDKLNDEHVDSSVVEDVRVSGDLAVARGRDTGKTTPRNGGNPVGYDLKWLMGFARQPDGTWKCIDEMWNDNPLPGAPGKRQQD